MDVNISTYNEFVMISYNDKKKLTEPYGVGTFHDVCHIKRSMDHTLETFSGFAMR